MTCLYVLLRCINRWAVFLYKKKVYECFMIMLINKFSYLWLKIGCLNITADFNPR